jgi:hypothetical protein
MRGGHMNDEEPMSETSRMVWLKVHTQEVGLWFPGYELRSHPGLQMRGTWGTRVVLSPRSPNARDLGHPGLLPGHCPRR